MTGLATLRPEICRPDAECPVRPGEPCTLCQVGATGRQDCGLVYLVMSDEELREGVHRAALARAGRRRPVAPQ